MSFELITRHRHAFAIADRVAAVVGCVASVAVVTEFLVTNRRVRLARHESIPTYYGALGAH